MPARACDACKARKVKCDGSESSATCSNCRMSNLPCVYLRVPRKRGPKPYSTSQQVERGRQRRCMPRLSTAGEGLATPSFLSPQSIEVPSSSDADHGDAEVSPSYRRATAAQIRGREDIDQRIQTIHRELSQGLAITVPSLSLSEVVSSCVESYLSDLLPIGPLVDGPTLRENIELNAPQLNPSTSMPYEPGLSSNIAVSTVALEALRSYTLTTAVCACAASMLPPRLVAEETLAGAYFLHASREMLKLYQDFDIECPNSSSIIIRIFHAGQLHTDSKVSLAWQVLGEALRLAQAMHLFEERSYETLDPLEARLRRLAFWQLYIMDRYAAIFEHRPTILHDFALGTSITTNCDDESQFSPFDPHHDLVSVELNDQLLRGFYICQRLWRSASDILVLLQTLLRFCQSTNSTDIMVEAQKMDIARVYLEFLGVLDAYPQFLHVPEAMQFIDGLSTGSTQRQHFWVHRANILITYHSLKMILLQKFADLGLVSLLGLSSDNDMIALRKTEIAHDLVAIITSVPFHALRANGEACVMKIRCVGATLLQVMQQSQASHVVNRARLLFTPLLDTLARLDSRASDELNQEYVA